MSQVLGLGQRPVSFVDGDPGPLLGTLGIGFLGPDPIPQLRLGMLDRLAGLGLPRGALAFHVLVGLGRDLGDAVILLAHRGRDPVGDVTIGVLPGFPQLLVRFLRDPGRLLRAVPGLAGQFQRPCLVLAGVVSGVVRALHQVGHGVLADARHRPRDGPAGGPRVLPGARTSPSPRFLARSTWPTPRFLAQRTAPAPRSRRPPRPSRIRRRPWRTRPGPRLRPGGARA